MISIKELYEGYKFKNILDIGGIFSNEDKMYYFFDFVMDEIFPLDEMMVKGEIDMLPMVYLDIGGRDNIVFDYNFLVQTTARYIHKNNLGDADAFIEFFKAESVDKSSKLRSVKLLFTHVIFEEIWKCSYINGEKMSRKYLNFSNLAVYKNNETAIQFGSVMFNYGKLLKIIGNNELMERLLEYSKLSKAKQVAFGTSSKIETIETCDNWWKKNKETHQKKWFYASTGLSVLNKNTI